MARKKKNDFWDDVEDLNTVSDNDQTGDDDTAEVAVDEEWSAVKSLPLKVIMRFLLMVSCLVALVSAYIAYEYVNDRYAGGSYSTDFFDSASFADEYNKSMDQLLQLVQAMEADPSVTQAGNEELLTTLVENYMGKDTNFSFMILDSDKYRIAASGDDAKDRIEGSNHYVAISNADGQTSIQSPIAGKLLNKDAWTKVLSETSNKYIIYSAVDNTLAQPDSFYKAELSFEKMGEYFGAARFVGIIAAVIFVICLIFWYEAWLRRCLSDMVGQSLYRDCTGGDDCSGNCPGYWCSQADEDGWGSVSLWCSSTGNCDLWMGDPFLFQYCQTYQSRTSSQLFHYRNDCGRYQPRYWQVAVSIECDCWCSDPGCY